MSEPDEAQQTVGVTPPLPNKATEILSFGIKVSVGASVEINGKDWIKSTSEGSLTWRSIPSPQEIKSTTTYMQRTLLEPVLQELLSAQGRAAVAKQENS